MKKTSAFEVTAILEEEKKRRAANQQAVTALLDSEKGRFRNQVHKEATQEKATSWTNKIQEAANSDNQEGYSRRIDRSFNPVTKKNLTDQYIEHDHQFAKGHETSKWDLMRGRGKKIKIWILELRLMFKKLRLHFVSLFGKKKLQGQKLSAEIGFYEHSSEYSPYKLPGIFKNFRLELKEKQHQQKKSEFEVAKKEFRHRRRKFIEDIKQERKKILEHKRQLERYR